jgi:hypothetical protein
VYSKPLASAAGLHYDLFTGHQTARQKAESNMTDVQDTKLPVINLNGTAASRLAEDYKVALDLAKQLQEAMRAIDFHPRNYPIEGTWQPAREEFATCLKQVDGLKTYLQRQFYHCKKACR